MTDDHFLHDLAFSTLKVFICKCVCVCACIFVHRRCETQSEWTVPEGCSLSVSCCGCNWTHFSLLPTLLFKLRNTHTTHTDPFCSLAFCFLLHSASKWQQAHQTWAFTAPLKSKTLYASESEACWGVGRGGWRLWAVMNWFGHSLNKLICTVHTMFLNDWIWYNLFFLIKLN